MHVLSLSKGGAILRSFLNSLCRYAASLTYLIFEDLLSCIAKLLESTLQLALPGSVLGSCNRLDLGWGSTYKGSYFIVSLGEQTREHIGCDKTGLAC